MTGNNISGLSNHTIINQTGCLSSKGSLCNYSLQNQNAIPVVATEEEYILYFVFLILHLFTAIIHSCGLYLMRCLFKEGKGDVELIYITNLSAVEAFGSIIYIVILILLIIYKWIPAVWILYVIGINYLIYMTVIRSIILMTMFYITIDRLMVVVVNIQYPTYWNMRKAKYLVIATWIIGLLTTCCFVIYGCIASNPMKVIFGWFKIKSMFNVLYILIAIASHSYIFYKYKQALIPPIPNMNASVPVQSLLRTFFNSRFYICALLVITYIFTVAIPDIFIAFFFLSSTVVRTVIGVMDSMAYLCDAFIYIYLCRPVKILLQKKIRSRFFNNRQSNVDTELTLYSKGLKKSCRIIICKDCQPLHSKNNEFADINS